MNYGIRTVTITQDENMDLALVTIYKPSATDYIHEGTNSILAEKLENTSDMINLPIWRTIGF